MKRKDILKDKSIKQISLDQIDRSDTDHIKSVGTINDHSKIGTIVVPLVVVAVGCILVLVVINFLFNYKLVQGDLYGSTFEVAGVSVIPNDYTPYPYISNGSFIYYDGSNNEFFNPRDNFSVAKVTKVGSDGKYYVELNGREVFVNAAQVNFVSRS